jgi:methanogenic corrinoid protein MtbC1
MPADTELLSQLSDALRDLEEERVLDLTRQALDDGRSPQDVIQHGLAPGITEVGNLFEQGEYFLPELLVAADVFTTAIEIVKPHLSKTAAGDKGAIVIGTVKGDIHEIGKNVVKLMLEVAGFTVHDLGIDVPLQAFVDKQRETGAEVVAASALLSSTMPQLKDLVELAKAENLPAAVIVGGAPVKDWLAVEYGADGYSPDAVTAVRLVEQIVEQVRARRGAA